MQEKDHTHVGAALRQLQKTSSPRSLASLSTILTPTIAMWRIKRPWDHSNNAAELRVEQRMYLSHTPLTSPVWSLVSVDCTFL